MSDEDMILDAVVTTTELHRSVGDSLVAAGQAITVDGWGIRIKETPHGCVYVERMIFTWRVKLVENPDSLVCGGIGWCYPGNNLPLALANAWAWDGSPDTEPSGWIRSIHDHRSHGEPKPGVRQI